MNVPARELRKHLRKGQQNSMSHPNSTVLLMHLGDSSDQSLDDGGMMESHTLDSGDPVCSKVILTRYNLGKVASLRDVPV